MAITWYVQTDISGGKTFTDGAGVWVPDNMGNRVRAELQQQIDAGEIVIEPWVPPPPPASDTKILAQAVQLLVETNGLVLPSEIADRLKKMAE